MINTINKITERVLVGVFFIMTISVVWQVLTRYLFNVSTSFTEELARFCLMWLAILGAAYITGKREHIAIDYFANKLSPKGQKVLDYGIELLILIFAVIVLIIGGGYLMYITLYMEQNSPALQVPLGLVYSVIPLSGVLMIIYTLDHLKKLKDKNYDTDES